MKNRDKLQFSIDIVFLDKSVDSKNWLNAVAQSSRVKLSFSSQMIPKISKKNKNQKYKYIL